MTRLWPGRVMKITPDDTRRTRRDKRIMGNARQRAYSGRVTSTVVPLPRVLSTSMVPPWARIRSRAMARPRPEPREPGPLTPLLNC